MGALRLRDKDRARWGLTEPCHFDLRASFLTRRGMPGPLSSSAVAASAWSPSPPDPISVAYAGVSSSSQGPGERWCCCRERERGLERERGFGAMETRHEPHTCHLLAVRPRATYLPSLSSKGTTELVSQVPPAHLRAWNTMDSHSLRPVLRV